MMVSVVLVNAAVYAATRPARLLAEQQTHKFVWYGTTYAVTETCHFPAGKP
jgi:hypothetical protein